MVLACYEAFAEVIDAYRLRDRLLRYNVSGGESREVSQQSDPIRAVRPCSLWGTRRR